MTTAAAAKSLSRVRLCDPRDGSPPGSPVPGILQARALEWGAIAFSKAWKWKVNVKSLSRVRLLVTLWTAAHQAPPSLGFSRQEHWGGVPSPSPWKMAAQVKSCQDTWHLQVTLFPFLVNLPVSKMSYACDFFFFKVHGYSQFNSPSGKFTNN